MGEKKGKELPVNLKPTAPHTKNPQDTHNKSHEFFCFILILFHTCENIVILLSF